MKFFSFLICILGIVGTASAEEGGEEQSPDVFVEPPVIRVVSNPSGMPFFIDGHPCGETPAMITVTPGIHEVVIEIQERRLTTSIVAVNDEVVEVNLDLGLPQVPQAAETTEILQAHDDETPRTIAPEVEHVPWMRDIPQHNWLDLGILSGAFGRNFEVPINPAVDSDSRDMAALDSSLSGVLGFRIAFFPAASNRIVRLRGLGVEMLATMGLSLDVYNARFDALVDASFYDIDLNILYNLILGRSDAGISLSFRLGWHRTSFRLGTISNDTVPTFLYDGIRLGLGLRIPLGTKHLLGDLRGSFIPIVSVGEDAETAYGNGDVSANAGEIQVGFVARFGSIELGLYYLGRWFGSDFVGIGEGWGDTSGGYFESGGIETLDTAEDSYQQLRIDLTFRL